MPKIGAKKERISPRVPHPKNRANTGLTTSHSAVERGGPRAGKAAPLQNVGGSDTGVGKAKGWAAGAAATTKLLGGGACSCRHKEQSSPCGPKACCCGVESPSPDALTTTNLTPPAAPQTNAIDWGCTKGAAPARPTMLTNHASTKREINRDERRRRMGD